MREFSFDSVASSAWHGRSTGCVRASARHQGFTLIELMMVVAIVGILAAIAGPQFSDMIRNTRLSAASSALQVSLSLARSEAIKRGADARVTVVAKGTAGHFENGWVVFVDSTGNGNGGVAPAVDASTLEVAAAPNAVSFSKNFAANYLTYNGQGRVNAFGSLYFFSGTSDNYCLVISSSGRVRVTRVGSGVACPAA